MGKNFNFWGPVRERRGRTYTSVLTYHMYKSCTRTRYMLYCTIHVYIYCEKIDRIEFMVFFIYCFFLSTDQDGGN